jgi:hypothetical protein
MAWVRAAYAAAGKSFSKRDPHFEAASIYDWYRSAFFDFNKHLSTKERAFIARCMELNTESWARPINDNFEYSLFSFSHRIQGSRVNSSRVFFAVNSQSAAPTSMMADIAKDRGLDPASIPEFEHAVGLGWDVEAGHFKIYLLHEDLAQVRDPDVRRLIAKVGDEPKYDIGLASVTTKGGAIIEKKAYVALKDPQPHWVKDYPFSADIDHTNLMITDRRGVVPQVDLAGKLDTHLNEMASRVVDRYRRNFKIEVDTITYNGKDDYTIYFPG